MSLNEFKMKYTRKDWSNRYAERSDLTTFLTHLTKNGSVDGRPAQVYDVLFAILKQKCIIGSTTQKGFIVGNTPAVCFQDSPLASLVQNIYFEQKFRAVKKDAKIRYLPFGLMFEKDYAFKKGARPVFYEQTEDSKSILPSTEWWRIVNMDLENSESIVDWTHEREWRCPNDFLFEYEDVRVVLSNANGYQRFIELCEKDGSKIHHKIAGIIVLDSVLR